MDYWIQAPTKLLRREYLLRWSDRRRQRLKLLFDWLLEMCFYLCWLAWKVNIIGCWDIDGANKNDAFALIVSSWIEGLKLLFDCERCVLTVVDWLGCGDSVNIIFGWGGNVHTIFSWGDNKHIISSGSVSIIFGWCWRVNIDGANKNDTFDLIVSSSIVGK